MEKQIVVFDLGNEQFGIEIACVEGIVKMQEITPIPYAPQYMEGITSLRGAVLPVMNLAKRFGSEMGQYSKESRIVIAIHNNQKVGMIVSAVSEVLTIDDSNIEPPPPMVSNINTEFICGIVRINEKLVILLDLETIIK
jgi:purine-binding chemotaxis protein CheW